MVSLGLTLMLICPAASPEAVAGPRFTKGDELHYVGEVVESSDAVENRYRKTHALEIRLFVLETDDSAATCALLTTLTRDADPALAPGMAHITIKAKKTAVPTAVRLDFVRIDTSGKTEWLVPENQELPVRFNNAARKAIPALPIDRAPEWELGFLPKPGAVGIIAEGTWNGRRCLGVTTQTTSDNYDRPDIAPKGWRCTQTNLVSQTEGCSCSVTRETVRRHGKEEIGKIAVKYELQPTNRFTGTRYTEARQEIEAAWAMTEEFRAFVTKPNKPADYAARAAKLEHYLEDHPGNGGFRVAIEALKRRAETYAAGTVPFVAPSIGHSAKKAEPLALGSAAPDFTAADVDFPSNRFRLNAAKGKPVVLVFYKPNSATSHEALTIAEALSKRYHDSATVVPLAIGAKPEVAADQRAELKYRVPVFDGGTVRKAYRIDTFPQFFVVDGQGKLNWSFDAGVGPEVGYLVKEALEKLIAEGPSR